MRTDMNEGQMLQKARGIIAGAEAALGPLSDGQKRDLLMDNTTWHSDVVRDVVAALKTEA